MANTTKIIRDLRNQFDEYQYGVTLGVNNIWFVDSVNGNASNSGKQKDRAVVTIDAAINLASADDTIIVLPGHVETVALATDLVPDKSINIIGIGEGTRRPTITMSAVASKIIFTADDILMRNFLFLIEHDVTIAIEITTGTDCWVDKCEFRNRVAATARQFVNCIDIGGAGSNVSDRAKVTNCKFTAPAVGSSAAILISGVADGIVIEDNWIFGDFGDACIQSAVIHTNCRIARNTFHQLQAADHALQFSTTSTGSLEHNAMHSAMAGITGVDPGACRSHQSTCTDAADTSGAIAPVAAS